MCEEESTDSDFWNLSIDDISEETCCKNFVKTTNQIDDVILKKSDTNEIKSFQFILIFTSNIQELTNSFSIKQFSYHSPPEKIPIHLKNSILLI